MYNININKLEESFSTFNYMKYLMIKINISCYNFIDCQIPK